MSIEKAIRTIKKDGFQKLWDEDGVTEEKRILLFLYTRGFYIHSNSKTRRYVVSQMVQRTKKIRQRMLQILKAAGDVDLSAEKVKQEHYVRTCSTIIRYFQQEGAEGFKSDMSTVTYFLREQQQQMDDPSFLQAPCVAMCYLLQCVREEGDEVLPPVDGSRLVRDNFFDERLYDLVVKDSGGDSCVLFKILEKLFFTSEVKGQQEPTCIPARRLPRKDASLAEEIREAPGLVSRFTIPENFKCDTSTESEPGIVRFTKWGEKGQFVPLPKSSDNDDDELEEWLPNWSSLKPVEWVEIAEKCNWKISAV